MASADDLALVARMASDSARAVCATDVQRLLEVHMGLDGATTIGMGGASMQSQLPDPFGNEQFMAAPAHMSKRQKVSANADVACAAMTQAGAAHTQAAERLDAVFCMTLDAASMRYGRGPCRC